MTIASEAAGSKPPLASSLAAGLNMLDAEAVISFTKYVRLVLPLDGFVFWVKADLVNPSALYNTSQYNTAQYSKPQTINPIAAIRNIQGSLHHTSQLDQDYDATIGTNTVIFTSLEMVDDFHEIDPQSMYIATYQGIQFAFNAHGKYYVQADLYHYVGIAVTSIMKPQIIDDIRQINTKALIISNSLPIWLNMPNYVPPYPGFICPVKLYPAFLVPDNHKPPFGSVHITNTTALVSTPLYDKTYGRSQLTKEHVKVTFYGLNNIAISDFMDFILQYSYDYNLIGLMNMPIIEDEIRTQSEFSTIAQKKSISFTISYLQSAVRQQARQMLDHALVKIVPLDYEFGPYKYVDPWVSLAIPA